MTETVGAIVIGRNEGERLVRCLVSLQGQAGRIVYVDSGSSDGSPARALELGAEVVELERDVPFTAARARNAGLERLTANPGGAPRYILFVDGDCEVRPDWVVRGAAHLDAMPDVAVVCGRRRERHPDASVWNRLIDAEWATPVGRTRECGGDAMMRLTALMSVGGFDGSLIAGEEPELCVRLRQAGWAIWRIDAEMTLHDAAMTRFGQWWRRCRRAGHAYAEGAAMHGRPPERHRMAETRRALIWGAGVPLVALAGLVLTPWSLAILLAWPIQVLRLIARGFEPARALFVTLGKIPEALGVLGYWAGRLSGRKTGLIEYK